MQAIASKGRRAEVALLVVVNFLKVITGWRAREAARERQLILGRRDTPATAVNALREATKIDVFQVADKDGVPLGVLKLWHDTERVEHAGGVIDVPVTRREFSVCHKQLAEAMGVRRMPLSVVQSFPGADVGILRERSLREVEEKLRRELQWDASERQVAPPAPVQPRVDSPPQLAVVPRASLPLQAAAPTARAQPLEPDRREPAAAVPQAVEARHARPLQREYEGVVQTFGVVPRRVTDQGVPRSFDHFGVNLKLTGGENAGSVTYVWGAELEPLLADAKVKPGDRVRITHVGREQLAGKEGRYKNLFAVKKL